MGVYINMEMPNNCRDCPLEDAYEGYNCRIVEKSANWGLEGRPSWCPLVPVPPHGDLIDRDAAGEKIWDDMRFPSNLANAQFFVNELREMPTVIPAE